MKTIKNLALSLMLTFSAINAFAQTAYEKAMTDKVAKVQQNDKQKNWVRWQMILAE